MRPVTGNASLPDTTTAPATPIPQMHRAGRPVFFQQRQLATSSETTLSAPRVQGKMPSQDAQAQPSTPGCAGQQRQLLVSSGDSTPSFPTGSARAASQDWQQPPQDLHVRSLPPRQPAVGTEVTHISGLWTARPPSSQDRQTPQRAVPQQTTIVAATGNVRASSQDR